ncbi:unnamed protein product [Cunninghamella blakesleeana]
MENKYIYGSNMPERALKNWLQTKNDSLNENIQDIITVNNNNNNSSNNSNSIDTVPLKRKRDMEQREHNNKSQLYDIAEVILPVYCETFTSTLCKYINQESLFITWDYYHQNHLQFASIKIYTSNTKQLVLENETVRPVKGSDEYNHNFADKDSAFYSDFYFNIVKSAFLKTIKTNDIVLKQIYHRDDPLLSTTHYNCAIHITFAANIDQSYIRKKLMESVFPFIYPLSYDIEDKINNNSDNNNNNNNNNSNALSFSVDHFYQYLQPIISTMVLSKCRSENLLPVLAPFQSQNVEWMVQQEGFNVNDDGSLEKRLIPDDKLPYLWEKLNITKNKYIYINRITQEICPRMVNYLSYQIDHIYHGGILADEMGLGKTVCTIALILLNNINKSDKFEKIHDISLKKTGATLIITPATLVHQWEQEIHDHAPSLRVAIYNGVKSLPLDADINEYSDRLADNDIVLTTYNVLCSEVYHAREVSKRPRRHDVKYEARRSPLVQYYWWRCILDEAQMVESTHRRATEMASLIPRHFSWGLTGTPLKSAHFENLYGLYQFVGYTGVMKLSQFKAFYSTDIYQPLFFDFSKSIMRRNVKSFLHDQLKIPKQNRHIIKLSFSTIEQHYYNELWSMCCNDAMPHWLDSIGWKLPDESSNDYDLYKNRIQSLRRWLTRLRENCIYPTIKGANQEDEVRNLNDALQIMIKQGVEKIEELQVTLCNINLVMGGMHELSQEWDKSLSYYLDNTPFILEMIDEYKKKIEKVRMDQTNAIEISTTNDIEGSTINNKKTKNKDTSLVSLQSKQNMWQNLLHQYYFYTAGIYHMLKEDDKENGYYEKAADTRRKILTRFQEKVDSSIKEVQRHPLVLIEKVSYSSIKGSIFLNEVFLERLDDLSQKMNDQLLLIEKWRPILRNYMTSSLVDSKGDEIEGNEYDQSFDIQQKCDIYQDVYQDILRDRNYYLTGFWNTQRVTNDQFNENEDQEQNKKIKELSKQLQSLRKELEPAQFSDNLQNMISQIKEKESLSHLSAMESNLIETELKRLNADFKKQKEIQAALENEYRRFSNLANHRIEYYRALQHISDNVQTWECENPKEELIELATEKKEINNTIDQQLSRRRYLENIAKENDSNGNKEKDFFCLICKENFTRGVVTYCGHMYCNECAFSWFRVSQKCPQCNSRVKKNEWYSIAWETASLQQLDFHGNQSDESSENMQAQIKEIKEVIIHEGLGAKLDSIVKHIKYIKMKNNGKCIVFSQWKNVLNLLSSGLTKNDIRFVDIVTSNKDKEILAFKNDPSINVILLHARTQSSGLNLTEAKTVFMIEPILNESMEKQAIGRVHRIGQTEETSVFWYIIRDTIEEKIQDIHNKKQRHRQLNHLDFEGTTEIAIASKSDGGGEYVSDEDLRKCFTNLPTGND